MWPDREHGLRRRLSSTVAGVSTETNGQDKTLGKFRAHNARHYRDLRQTGAARGLGRVLRGTYRRADDDFDNCCNQELVNDDDGLGPSRHSACWDVHLDLVRLLPRFQCRPRAWRSGEHLACAQGTNTGFRDFKGRQT